MNELKQLPRDKSGQLLREFKANGKKYIIRSPQETFTFIRLNEYQKWSLILQHGRDHQSQYNAWNKAVKMADKAALGDGFSELSAYLYSQRENLKDLVQRKYDAASIIATLFIIREDEDIRTWNQALAEEKVNDWNEEGYSPFDFFLLVMNSSPELKNLYQKIMDKAEGINLLSLVGIS